MTATANVIIIVEDYNDNVPVFNPISTIFLGEHHEEDVPFITVNTTDADINNNGMVRYALGNGSLSRTFRIN